MPSATRRDGIRMLAGLGLMGLSGCGVVARAIREETTGLASPGPTDKDRAKVAWQYFRSARNGATGLVETSAGGGFSTTATIGDQLAAAICALRLGAIDRREFDAAISPLLVFLHAAPLARGQLPGRFYACNSGQLMDPPAIDRDPGWSGVQLGRLLLWIRTLALSYPQYAHSVAGIVERWQICAAIDGQGQVLQGPPGSATLATVRDVATGYGVYAAQGYRAWGLAAADNLPKIADYSVTVEGVDFPIAGAGSAIPPLHVVPYALLGMEMGWHGPDGAALHAQKSMADRLFAAQERRRARTRIVTARSDFRRNSAPYALTGTVVGGGTPWATLAEDGSSQPALALISTKAAFAMWAMGAPSAKAAMSATSTLFDSDTGWLEGRYEASAGYEWTRTASTNAIVLEALLHRELGRILPADLKRPIGGDVAGPLDCVAPQ